MLEVTCWNMPSIADRAEADLHYYQEGLWYWSMDAKAELEIKRKRLERAKEVCAADDGAF
jgi:hypothetical protein